MSRLRELRRKVLAIEQLPTLAEAQELYHALEYRYRTQVSRTFWEKWCHDRRVWHIPTIEFVDALVEVMRELEGAPCVEICAGKGKLSYHLHQRGIEIVATDDFSWGSPHNSALVERLSHRETLERYRPSIVLGSWIPMKTRIGFDVMDFPSVRYFIDIGEKVDHATWMTAEVYQRTDWERRTLPSVERYSFSASDDFLGNPTAGAFHTYSAVTLFTRISETSPAKKV